MQVRRERHTMDNACGKHGFKGMRHITDHKTRARPLRNSGATRLVCEAPGRRGHWHGRKYFPAVIFIAPIRSFHLWSVSAVEMRVFSCWYMRASF